MTVAEAAAATATVVATVVEVATVVAKEGEAMDTAEAGVVTGPGPAPTVAVARQDHAPIEGRNLGNLDLGCRRKSLTACHRRRKSRPAEHGNGWGAIA